MKEITCIRFNKVATKDDILATVYVVGEPFHKRGMARPLKVISISYTNKTKRDRIVVEFEDKSFHEIGIGVDCEIFYKETETKNKEK